MRLHLFTISFALASPLCFATQITAEAAVQTKKFEIPSNSKCSVDRFDIVTFDNQFFMNKKHSRSSLLAASWQTSTDDCLEDFGVVQYIKGCIYSSSYNPDTNKEEKYFGYVRQSRGKSIRFQHKTWEVDSIDEDPLYASFYGDQFEENKRHDWHKIIIDDLFSFDEKPENISSETFFNRKNYMAYVTAKENQQKTNRLFVTDLPSGSDYRPNEALGHDWISTSSLEFKTCLYHKKDIPVKGDPRDFNHKTEDGGPIHCFDWSDKTKPNYETKRIERTEELDEFCFKD